MNHDYDEELGKNTDRRSRRNPRLRGSGEGADAVGQETGGGVRPARQEKEIWEKRRQTSRRQAEQALDVMGDSAVHPLKRTAQEERKGSASPERSQGEGTGIRRQLEAQAAKRKKRRRMITMIVAECIALVFIFGYAYVARLANMIQRPDSFDIRDVQTNELNVNTVETMKGYWTIAIFGVDARDNAINKGTNADVNIICNVNRDTGEIKLVSVFRDTYLNISEKGSYNKLNQSYFLGGPEQAVQALNRNLDLNINDYITFNWKAVADAINVLGGIDIELSKAEFYYINSFITETVKATGVGSTQLTHAGMNHLDGVQAVAYGRLRLMDTDYARTERQRKVIALAFEKAKKADFKTLNVLIGTVFPQVSTSIWVDDMVSNAKNISKFHLGETTGFPQARGDANMGKKGAVVVPQTLESNVIKLHEFLFGDTDYTPSQTVRNISAKIAEDTGMYKEGKYVESVSTDGGVIQPPKATKAAASDSASESDKETESGKKKEETDADGKRIESETDADGNIVKSETDEDGRPKKTTADESETDELKTEAETDEDGNPVRTESGHPSHTGASQESTTAVRPTESGHTATSRPGSTGSETTHKPGSVTETPGSTTTQKVPGSSGGSTGNKVSPTPGSSSSETAPTAPGSSSGTSGGPGSSASAPTTATVPATTKVPAAPGNSGSGIPDGPGSQGSSSMSGTVAAPGQ
ncbi:MAG: LCP family protein [Lachnospiraceae bacterium]|nr:LCP family protein [Lachnospiraceae bacterium]